LLSDAYNRYENLILKDSWKLGSGDITSCSVFVECPCEQNQIVDANESYTLDISATGDCAITAAN